MNEDVCDEASLLFNADVFLANIPSLVADLGSAKYALLSFSEKSRSEVKLKSQLIPEISAALRDMLEERQRLNNKQQELNRLEMDLVRAAPPRFVSAGEHAAAIVASTTKQQDEEMDAHSSEALPSTGESEDENGNNRGNGEHVSPPAINNNNNNNNKGENDDKSGTKGMVKDEQKKKKKSIDEDVDRPMVVLLPDDLRAVREAESLLNSEREELSQLSHETNGLEEKFELDRVNCEEMTQHVQSLKWEYENLRGELRGVQWERRLCTIWREEREARVSLVRDGHRGMDDLFAECRRAELAIITQSLETARAEASTLGRELDERRSAQEMELAVYQIAYKEQQAAAEGLKDAIAHRRRHARELVRLAKVQEIEEARQRSVRRLVMASLHMNTDDETPELTQEHLMELRSEEPLVCNAATRVGLLEERRHAVAAVLAHVSCKDDAAELRGALERTRDILKEDITLEMEALRWDEGE